MNSWWNQSLIAYVMIAIFYSCSILSRNTGVRANNVFTQVLETEALDSNSNNFKDNCINSLCENSSDANKPTEHMSNLSETQSEFSMAPLESQTSPASFPDTVDIVNVTANVVTNEMDVAITPSALLNEMKIVSSTGEVIPTVNDSVGVGNECFDIGTKKSCGSSNSSSTSTLSDDEGDSYMYSGSRSSILPSPYDNTSTYPELQQVNWAAFTCVQSVNVTESLEIVRTVPILHYFDVIKSDYRTNVIGELVEKALPDLVVRMERKFTKKNGTQYVYDVPVIDSSKFFMHFIVCLQEVEKKLTKLYQDVEETLADAQAVHKRLDVALLSRFPAFHQILHHIGNDNTITTDVNITQKLSLHSDSWQHSNTLKVKVAIGDLSLRLLQSKYNQLMQYINQISTQFEHVNTIKKRLHDEEHDNQLKFIHHSNHKLQTMDLHRVDEMDKLLIQSMDIQSSMDLETMKFEYDMTYQRINNTVQRVVNNIHIKVQLETENERNLEEFRLHLLKFKEETARKAFVESFQKLLFDFSTSLSDYLDRPWEIIWWLGNFFMILISFAGAYEILKIVQLVVVKYLFSKNKITKYSKHSHTHIHASQINRNNRNTNQPNSVNGKRVHMSDHDTSTLILNEQEAEKIDCIVRVLSTAACVSRSSTARVPLPNIMILGPPGTGKSVAAVMIAQATGLPYAILNGADLEAEGLHAGWTLRELLADSTPVVDTSNAVTQTGGKSGRRMHQQQESKSNSRILIIDDASAIIRSRHGSISNGCKSNGSHLSGNGGGGNDRAHASEGEGIAAAARSDGMPFENGSYVENCFYALLQGLRLNTTNLCVILVCSDYTRAAVSSIDHAILDRMDQIVGLSLPGVLQRVRLVITTLHDMLKSSSKSGGSGLLDASGKSELDEFESSVEAMLTSSDYVPTYSDRVDLLFSCVAANVNPNSSLQSKKSSQTRTLSKPKSSETTFLYNGKIDRSMETTNGNDDCTFTPAQAADDTITTVVTKRGGRKKILHNNVSNESISLDVGSASTTSHSDNMNSFQVKLCVMSLTELSEGWSCREIKKLLQNMISRVLATESCKLTTAIWMTECTQFSDQRKLIM